MDLIPRLLSLALAAPFVALATAQSEPGRAEPGRQDPAALAQARSTEAEVAARAAVLAAAGQLHGRSEWPQGPRRAGFAIGDVELRGYQGGEVCRVDTGMRQRSFLDRQGEPRLLVEGFVDEDVAAAQLHLLHWLAHVSKPGAVPTASDGGIPVGDAGFVGWSNQRQQRIAWIAFVRGNVAVRVCCLDPSLDPHPDMAAVAQAVDAAIQREAVLEPGQAVPRPTIDRFAAAGPTCRAGDIVPLELRIASATGRELVQFVFEGPGSGYVQADARGAWHLHSTGAGSIRIHVSVTGARGATTTASASIDVLPRR